MGILQQKAREAIDKYGGVRDAARALGLSASTISLLASGQRKNASESTLRKLGLTKEVRAIKE
jgi:transcriptional regulator with XRE-family HTH domain